MKTRENELHEPIVSIEYENNSNLFYRDKVECSVCRYLLYKSKSKMSGKKLVKNDIILPNYCPNCGARLKEI